VPLPDRDDVTEAEGVLRGSPGQAFNPILDRGGFARTLSQDRLSRWRCFRSRGCINFAACNGDDRRYTAATASNSLSRNSQADYQR
jgi:hypothetical protein